MLDSSTIQELVRLLFLRVQREARSGLTGLYASRFRGRGLEFAELVEYQDGDDAGSIDWLASLRSGRMYRKRYQEEREIPLILACDCSASISCQPQVLQALREAVALFAGCAASSQDPIGLVFFSDHLERRLPPGRGLRQVRRLLSELYEYQASGRLTDLAALFQELGNAFRQPCRILVFSDLYAADYTAALGRLARIHDVLVCHLVLPPGQGLPPGVWLEVEDAEQGKRCLFNNMNAENSEKETDFKRQLQRIRQEILDSGADYLLLPPEQAVATNILQFFRTGISP
ncbi:MAG: DUF58 domain-containing protein [Lentisphaeria bacterium]